MILSEVNRYVRARQRVTLTDVALHFGVEMEAARGMLEVLAAKGRVRELPQSQCKEGCCSCSAVEGGQIWEVLSRDEPH